MGDLANGLGLLMISQFTAERRDVVRSLTLSHFKNNTALLLDIVLDSASETVFAQRLLEWAPAVVSAWIYKLSLQYSSRMAGVKKLFVQCLVNSVKKVQPTNRHIRAIPQLVSLFVDKAKAFHLRQRQKEHEMATQQQQHSQNAVANNSSASSGYAANRSSEQWLMNVEESERERWAMTIRCDSKRMKQCLSEMKNHRFSDVYLPPKTTKHKEDDKKASK